MNIEVSILPFYPRMNWVVIQRDPDEAKIGSFVLPDQAKKKMNRGTVLAVGPGTHTTDGTLIPIGDIQPGNVVQWADGGGVQCKIRDQEYTFVPSQNIIVVELATPALSDAEFENKLAAMCG